MHPTRIMRLCISTVLIVAGARGPIFAADSAARDGRPEDGPASQGVFSTPAGWSRQSSSIVQILAAVDAGSLPTAELGHSLGPLTQIYRTWGRNEDALQDGPAVSQVFDRFAEAQTRKSARRSWTTTSCSSSIFCRGSVATTKRSDISQTQFEPVKAVRPPIRRAGCCCL